MYEALLKVQKEIGAIKKDSDNPYFKSKYFDINSLLSVVKPILNKHGFVLTQAMTNLGISGAVSLELGLRTRLTLAETGDFIEDVCVLPKEDSPQKVGSSITYFRRYALQSLLALEAEDDDANSASGKFIDPRGTVSGSEKPIIKKTPPKMEYPKEELGETPF